MKKIRFWYHEFEDAPRTTEESRRIEGGGFLIVGAFCVCLILGAIAFFCKGSIMGGVLCIIAMMELMLIWMNIVQRTIFPELMKKAEAERIQCYAMILQSNKESPDPQTSEQNRLRQELNDLLEQEKLSKDESRRIGELVEILESMGDKFDG